MPQLSHTRMVTRMFNRIQTFSPVSPKPKHKHSNNASLKVLQWNCQGLRGKLASLQFIAQDYDLLCIQESLLQESNKLSLKGFRIIRRDISGPSLRGICTCIRADIPFSIFGLDDIVHPSIEALGIVIYVDDSPCLLVNVYRHPGQNTPHSVLDKLFSYQHKFPYTLFLGDFNAHHIYWFNSYDDGPGRSLARSIDSHSLVILNTDHPTLVLPPGSRDYY